MMTYFSEPFCTITAPADKPYLLSVWTGMFDEAAFERAHAGILAAIQGSGRKLLLLDVRKSAPPTATSEAYFSEVMFPIFAAKGIRKVVLLQPEDVFAQMVAQNIFETVDAYEDIQLRVLCTMAEAEKWLVV